MSFMFSVIDKKYIILDCPSEETLPRYLDVLKEQSVTDLVRICDADNTYNAKILEDHGITVHDDIKFQDGGVPDGPAIEKWLQLTYRASGMIGVHCVSGIGRAPVLVTISLIENGMDPLDAIEYIRKHRRGALNKRQIQYIDRYKSRRRKRNFFSSLFKGS